MQFLLKFLLCPEVLGNLDFEFVAFTAQDVKPSIVVCGLECHLLQLLVQLLKLLLVNSDLRNVQLVASPELVDLPNVSLFFAFDVPLMQRFLLLDVCH